MPVKDPFAPARRSLVLGPVMALAGGALIYLGVRGGGLAVLLCVLGGILVLLGLLRLLGASAVLLVEGRRKEILRDGAPSTAVINSATKTGTRMGYPIYEMELTVRLPDGSEHPAKKSGAIPPQYEGSLEPGDELQVKIRAEDREFAVDWGGGW